MSSRNTIEEDRGTEETLQRMSRQGDDLLVSRDIDFTVVFADEYSARAFVRKIGEPSLKILVEKTGTKPLLPWDVLVVKHAVPSAGLINDFEELLQSAADEHNGHNDGWGCITHASLPNSCR